MTIKNISLNAIAILILGWVMASFASIDTPETVQIAIINQKLDKNTSRIEKIEKDIDSLRVNIGQSNHSKE